MAWKACRWAIERVSVLFGSLSVSVYVCLLGVCGCGLSVLLRTYNVFVFVVALAALFFVRLSFTYPVDGRVCSRGSYVW